MRASVLYRINSKPLPFHNWRWLAALLLGGLFSSLLPNPVLAQYRFDTWTTEQGLPQATVLAITQTRDGYLWLGTYNGLARFDGVRFTIFDKRNTPGMSVNDCFSLYEDSAGALWIGTVEGSVMRYQNGGFTSFMREQGKHSQVEQIREGRPGELLLSIQSGSAWWRNGGYAEEPNSAADFSIRLGPSGTRWSLDKDGLHSRHGGQVRHYVLPAVPKKNWNTIYETRDSNVVWVAMRERGIFKVQDGQVIDYTQRLGLTPDQAIQAVLEDRDGTFWFGTNNAGLIRFRDEPGAAPTRYTTADGLSSNIIHTFFQDREGTLWIGTGAGGLNRITPQFISGYSTAQGLGGDITHAVLADRAGNIWAATHVGLSKITNGVITNYNSANGLPLTGLQSLHEDSSGRLWIGAFNGLFSFKDGIFSPPIPHMNVWAIHEDRQGQLWVGAHFGLYKFKDGVRTGYSKQDGLPSNTVRAIHEDRQGTLWFGTEGGLVKYRDGQFTVFTIRDGLASNRIWSIYEDVDGTLWLGTFDGGLSRFKDGRFANYLMEQGLYSNSVFLALEDGRGNFWMTGYRGPFSVSKQQLNDLADGKIRAVTSISYGKVDGLLSRDCNGGRQPSGVKMADGRLLFTTLRGIAVVNPEAAPLNPLPPPVQIETVKIDTAEADARGEIRVQPGQANLEIGYIGLSFIKPEQMRFRYKLIGQDQDWIEAGARRTANYSYLPPGQYTFNVIAANSDGVWNEMGASLRIVIVPPFYRTWWFLGLTGLSLAGLVILIYRLRVAQLRKQHAVKEAFSRQLLESQETLSRRLIESQESERKRIAAELHDGLGQSLVIIKNRALHSLTEPEDHDRAIEQIEEIADAATQAILETREIAYNLRPFHIDRLGLTTAIGAMIKRASNDNLHFTTELDSIDGLLAPEQEINFYRIVQECLNNILKHSEASAASVTIKRRERHDHMIELTIRDNGRGFTPGVRQESTNGSGFGLLGLNERARILGGSLTIASAPGQGTTTQLKLTVP
jgi:signal transduction histidine kinase/ligand-binding sensor domain-containing protein